MLLLLACAHHPEPDLAEPVLDEPHAIYFVLLDRFAPTHEAEPHDFHGGTLWGLLNRLDWIQKLGFDAVWVSPIWQTRAEAFGGYGAFHGYWVLDHRMVDPRFGGEKALDALSRAIQQRGMKLYLDVVYNHVAWDSPLRTEHPDWFHPSVGIQNWEDPLEVQTHEVHGLPDLMQEKPEVYDYLWGWTRERLEKTHPAGFRVDAVKHLDSGFLPRLSRDIFSLLPGFFLLGEIFDGNPRTLAPAWEQSGLSAVFDFPLHYAMLDTFCYGAEAGRLASILSEDWRYPGPARLVTFLDNHDLPRISSACGGNFLKVRAALDFLLGARGIPSMTYGTEVGLEGKEEPENRGDMVFKKPIFKELIQESLGSRRSLWAKGKTWVEKLKGNWVLFGRTEGLGELGWELVWFGEEKWQYKMEGCPSVRGVATQTVWITYPPSPVKHCNIELNFDGPGVARWITEGTIEGVGQLREVFLKGGHDGWKLSGGDPALGDWNPELAPEFVNGELQVKLRAGSVVAVKEVRKEGEEWKWQGHGNRYLLVPRGEGAVELELEE